MNAAIALASRGILSVSDLSAIASTLDHRRTVLVLADRSLSPDRVTGVEKVGSNDRLALWHILRWPLILVFALVSFEGIYNYAPDLPPGSHRPWGTPGAVIGVALWVASSYGLRLYLLQVQSYATSYGSVSAVIVLLLWFYLSAFAVVAGGQINSVVSRHIAAHRNRGGARQPSHARPARPAVRGRRGHA